MTATEIPTPDPRTLEEEAQGFATALSGQYAIKRLIGRGGMGIVYLARDKRLERLVAIKTLPPQLAADPSVRERFLRETRTAGGMSHPNIVPIHGADEIDGHVFFVMGYVEGESLATHVRRRGRLDPRGVVRHLRDVSAALAHAHQRGIIHRDVKAENILIERSSGRALVTDFGIARFAEAAPLTATGQLLGTVYYVSPEQVQGDPVDVRSDIYSLGVVGFLALSGRFPFESDLASAVLVAHVTKGAPPLSTVAADVPPALAAVIDRCLSKNPAHRFATADELAAALEAAIPEVERQVDVRVAPRPALISDTEAHQVWKRAAELQALTGVQPRPEPVPRERDRSRDASRTSGFQVADVRSAADEAGIAGRYVEHALVEHGLAPGGAPKPVPPRPQLPAPEPRRSWWAGGALKFGHEIVVEGEMPARDFDGLLNTLRDETGDLGRTTARSRELSWHHGGIPGRLHVSVVPDNGRTTIHLAKNIRAKATVAFFSTIWAVGVMGGGGFGAVLADAADDGFGVIAALGIGLGSIGLARKFVRSIGRKERGRLANLAEALAAKARESIRREESRLRPLR